MAQYGLLAAGLLILLAGCTGGGDLPTAPPASTRVTVPENQPPPPEAKPNRPGLSQGPMSAE